MTDRPTNAPAPDAAPCWDGSWRWVDPLAEVWAVGSVNRTVASLPQLHPWRLGDPRGGARMVQWAAAATDDDGSPLRHDDTPVVVVLTVQARDPELAAGDAPAPDLLSPAVVYDPLASLVGELGSRVGGAVTSLARGTAPRWAGAVARLAGSWLPPLAVLPRGLRGLDDPRTGWVTESHAFNDRHTVHAADPRYAAGVLAPHLMAIVLDIVHEAAAVTVAGDAVHVWWPYRPLWSERPALARHTAEAAAGIAAAIPSFVRADHPDHSHRVTAGLVERRDQARSYQEQRRHGHSPDPVMQRIYDRARAAHGLPGLGAESADEGVP